MRKSAYIVILLVSLLVIAFTLRSYSSSGENLTCFVEDIEPTNFEAKVINDGIFISWENSKSDCFQKLDYYHLIWRDEYMLTINDKEEMVNNVSLVNLTKETTEYFITHICKEQDGYAGEYPSCMEPLDDGTVYSIEIGFVAGDIIKSRGEQLTIEFKK